MAEPQYQVVGALAAFTVAADDGTSQKITFYKGQMVPPGASAEEIEHNLSVRLIAEVNSAEEAIPAMTGPLGDGTTRPPEGNALAEPVPLQSAPVAVSPMVASEERVAEGTGVALKPASEGSTTATELPSDGSAPATSASKAEWIEYGVVRQGRDRAALEALSKADLVKELRA